MSETKKNNYETLSPTNRQLVNRAVLNEFLGGGSDGDTYTAPDYLRYCLNQKASHLFDQAGKVVHLAEYRGRTYPIPQAKLTQSHVENTQHRQIVSDSSTGHGRS